MSVFQIVILSIVVIAVFFLGATIIGIWRFRKKMNKADPINLAHLIREKIDEGQAALSCRINRKPWLDINEDVNFPLASLTQIVIALDYAKQAAAKEINSEKTILVEELERFYIPKTDGNAHENWLTSLNHPTEVTLKQVAEGMVEHSSNANTDYLIYHLGIDSINKTLNELELTAHDDIVPITPQLYLPVKLMNEGMSKDEAFKYIEALPRKEYEEVVLAAFNDWCLTPPTKETKSKIYSIMSMSFQKMWTNKLAKSNTKDYVKLMGKLNRETYYSKEVYSHFTPLLRYKMKIDPEIKHYAQKAGATAYAISLVSYAETVSNHIELTYMLNDLNTVEQTLIRGTVERFQTDFMVDPDFRRKVKEVLTEPHEEKKKKKK